MSEPNFKRHALTPTPLQAHYQQCSFAGGVAHRVQCAGEAIGAFASSHIVSVLFGCTLLGSLILSLHIGSP